MAGQVGFATKMLCGRNLIFNSKWCDAIIQQSSALTSLNYCLPRFLSTSISKQDEKPKKPATHFLLYYKSVKEGLDKKYPEGNPQEKVKIATQMYKDLSQEEKEALEEKSRKLIGEYKEKLEKWQSTLSPDEMKKIKAEKTEKKEKSIKKKITQLQRENAKPKKSSSAFVLYVADQLKHVHLKDMPAAEKLLAVRKNVSDCGQKWKDMKAEEKEVYNKKAAEDRELYELEMTEWEMNMIEQGKENLIRKKTLASHQRAEKIAAKEMKPRKKKATKEVESEKKGSSETVKKEGKTGADKKEVRFEDS